LDEPTDTYDDLEIRRIVRAADKFMRDGHTSPKLRRQVLSFVQGLHAECQEADQSGREGWSWSLLEVARAAFAIGAIAGNAAMVTGRSADRRAAGGVASGQTRRMKAELWRAHARDLMREIRINHEGWSREKVAIEALSRWRLQDVEPPESSRSLVELLKELEADGTIPARTKLKRTSSLPK